MKHKKYFMFIGVIALVIVAIKYLREIDCTSYLDGEDDDVTYVDPSIDIKFDCDCE